MFEKVLPPIQTYEARDGRSLCYRHYLADSNKVVILLHGISEDGQYLHPLAEFISKRQLAQVIVPDLRGYGLHPVRRGDVEYIGQHDDDIEDLIKWLRSRASSPLTLIMAGHSGGGGNAIRLAVHRVSREIAAFLLLAPSVHPKAPISHEKEPWSTIQIDKQRVRILTVLSAVGIRHLNKWVVMRNDKPIASRHGRETLELSYRLMLSRTPKAKYERYLRAMTQPTLVLVGDKEEVFIPGQYAPMFAQYNQAKVETVLDCDHDGILANKGTFREVESWLRALKV
ncbi:alpha/beta fold hydrolase [Cohnella herbarum]|uniref:Alpha/beta hydrolase n=1 Tax=Cohnella herbarum TaxID=2728023 RepID=A0A7Z2VP28_9BACL|nr:alpha/beta hydrolase [Cohnella herbarum]QJD86566.1 alpha/beta hydrolase [Cohnella herbarum]